jgi:hypothetical protein
MEVQPLVAEKHRLEDVVHDPKSRAEGRGDTTAAAGRRVCLAEEQRFSRTVCRGDLGSETLGVADYPRVALQRLQVGTSPTAS